MFGFFSRKAEPIQSTFKKDEFVSTDGIALIRQMKNGRFRLLVNQNEVVGTYTRRRDAVRGAARRGLTVA